jgi:hypothetical protein
MYMGELCVPRELAPKWCNAAYAGFKMGTLNKMEWLKTGKLEYLVVKSAVSKQDREDNRRLAEDLDWSAEQLEALNNPKSVREKSSLGNLDLHEKASVFFAKDKDTLKRALRHQGNTVVNAKNGGAIGVYASHYRSSLIAGATSPVKAFFGTLFAKKLQVTTANMEMARQTYQRGALRYRGYYCLLALASDLTQAGDLGGRSSVMVAGGLSNLETIASMLSRKKDD